MTISAQYIYILAILCNGCIWKNDEKWMCGMLRPRQCYNKWQAFLIASLPQLPALAQQRPPLANAARGTTARRFSHGTALNPAAEANDLGSQRLVVFLVFFVFLGGAFFYRTPAGPCLDMGQNGKNYDKLELIWIRTCENHQTKPKTSEIHGYANDWVTVIFFYLVCLSKSTPRIGVKQLAPTP